MIVGDRLSGWSDVFGTLAGTTVTDANALVRLLRSHFATFGVPEEISSDSGPKKFRKPLYHQQWPPRHETQFPSSVSNHIVDETSSEDINHGQPQDIPDDAPTATYPTSVMDTNSQESDPNTHETNKSVLPKVPRRSSHLR